MPYGPGFEIPLAFSYEDDGRGPFRWRMQLAVIDGRPRCVQLVCWTVDATRTVTPEALHRFPLGRLVEDAALMASRPSDEVPRSVERWESIDQIRAERAAVAAHHRQRPNGRKRKALTDEFLSEVAAVYRQHVATGKPSKAVEEQFHYTAASARRVVREARLRGFLGPAHPGRGGEQSQPKEENDA